MEEVTDEPLYRDRVCGIDIGKAGLAATIRVPSDKDPAWTGPPNHTGLRYRSESSPGPAWRA